MPIPNQTGMIYGRDPLFVDESNGDHHLQPASPGIDAGITEGLSLPDVDLDGNPRIVGEKIDIGAYE